MQSPILLYHTFPSQNETLILDRCANLKNYHRPSVTLTERRGISRKGWLCTNCTSRKLKTEQHYPTLQVVAAVSQVSLQAILQSSFSGTRRLAVSPLSGFYVPATKIWDFIYMRPLTLGFCHRECALHTSSFIQAITSNQSLVTRLIFQVWTFYLNYFFQVSGLLLEHIWCWVA